MESKTTASTSTSNNSTPIEALPQSRLGTKEHWDSVYQREVKAYSEIGDEGEVWFGDSSVKRMKNHLERKLPSLYNLEKNPCRILDLGCGNGHLLFSFLGSKSPDEDDDYDSEEEEDREEEDEEELENEIEKESQEDSTDQRKSKTSSLKSLTKPEFCLGIDYSKLSIDLAKDISLKRGNGCEKVKFEISDLMNDEEVEKVRKFSISLILNENDGREEGWDLVCDKGTLDAIALSSLEDSIPKYLKAVKRVTRSNGGLFMITSCNFTEKELNQMFTESKDFEIESVVPTPSFSFGGQKGSTTTTIVFRRI